LQQGQIYYPFMGIWCIIGIYIRVKTYFMNFLKRLYISFWDIIADIAIRHYWPSIFGFAFSRVPDWFERNVNNTNYIDAEVIYITHLSESPVDQLLLKLEQGNYELVKALIDNQIFRTKLTPEDAGQILDAVASNNHIEILLHLRDTAISFFDDASIDWRGKALSEAAKNGLFQIVECLCNIPNFINSLKQNDKDRAFYLAARYGHTNIVNQLLAIPGFIDSLDPSSKNEVLCIAAKENHLDIVELLGDNLGKTKTLNLNYLPYPYKNNPLYNAVRKDHLKMIKCLCKIPNFSDLVPSEDKTHALTLAVEYEHIKVIEYLRKIPGFIESTTPFYIQVNFDRSKSIEFKIFFYHCMTQE
jgi:ankyrin repeat protein